MLAVLNHRFDLEELAMVFAIDFRETVCIFGRAHAVVGNNILVIMLDTRFGFNETSIGIVGAVRDNISVWIRKFIDVFNGDFFEPSIVDIFTLGVVLGEPTKRACTNAAVTIPAAHLSSSAVYGHDSCPFFCHASSWRDASSLPRRFFMA
jgi:hypothetical protein